MEREEHLKSCKERALKYLNQNDLLNAVTSMLSDLEKHPETKPNRMLEDLGFLYLEQGSSTEIRRWIEGFR